MDSDKIEKKKILRKTLICYFLAIAKAQQATQQLQQQLIMHPYFNPMLLFKKISQNQLILTKKAFKQYLVKHTSIGSKQEIDVYLTKNQFGKYIDCQQFITSILPYTPDILRYSQSTITWQIKSSPNLKKDTQQIYIEIIQTQVNNLVNISSFRNKFRLNWQQLKKLIEKDLKLHGTILQKRKQSIQNQIKIQNNFISKIRNWMQIWIEVDEKDMLNIARWIGGTTEYHVKNYFQDIFLTDILCKCPIDINQKIRMKKNQNKQVMSLRSLSIKPLSRFQKQMYERKINYIISDGKYDKIPLSRSISYSYDKNYNRKISVFSNRPHKVCHQKQQKLTIQKAISLWCQYIQTILTGQQMLAQKRERIKNSFNQVMRIIKQNIMSRKKQITKIHKIISFIQKNIHISILQSRLMNKTISELSISNDVLLSIFKISMNRNQQINDNLQQTSPHKSFKYLIAQILKNYCITKSKLIKISQQLISQNLIKFLYKLLDPYQNKCITKQNLMIVVSEMGVQLNENDAQILMRHFGNNQGITQSSFFRVFQIQGK